MNPLDPRGAALHIGLHELTAAAAHWRRGYNPRATFEVWLDRLPPDVGYVLAAGVEQVARFLLDYRVAKEHVQFLRNLFVFHQMGEEFWTFLGELRFRGDLKAAPEGTPVFPGVPFLQITAPLIEAQVVGSYVLSVISHQMLVATIAARMVQAAGEREVVEHGADCCPTPAAGVLAARAAYIAGAAGTTNLEAARALGIPIHPTMDPSFVLAHADDLDAYRSYQACFSTSTTLVVDPEDPAASGAALTGLDGRVRAVRIARGDLAALTVALRGQLDRSGRSDTRIIASGDLDESRIERLVKDGAPIDAFFVGPALAAPARRLELHGAYRLVGIGGDAKELPAGARQVYRRFAIDGTARADAVALASEQRRGAPVLLEVLTGGEPTVSRPGLETARAYAARAIARLPTGVKRLRDPEPYPVEILAPARPRTTSPPAPSPTYEEVEERR